MANENEVDVDALDALLAAATPGPWETGNTEDDGSDYRSYVVGPDDWTLTRPGVNNARALEDAAAIVALRNAFPALLRELRQHREREAQRGSCARCGGAIGAVDVCTRCAITVGEETAREDDAELRALREVAEAARAWDRAVEGDGRPDVARRDTMRALDRLDAVRGSK